MKTRPTFALLVLALAVLEFGLPSAVSAQEARLVGRLPEPVRTQVDTLLDGARAAGLPTEPLVDRALEGAAKGAPPDRIIAALALLRRELSIARDAFGDAASAAELAAGASALRAGATRDDLAELRRLRSGQPLTVAAAVLADLAAAGVPIDTGIVAVLAMATDAGDADYIAFRRNVERDIALGASPAAAIGVRLRAVSELPAADPQSGLNSGTRSPPRKKKP